MNTLAALRRSQAQHINLSESTRHGVVGQLTARSSLSFFLLARPLERVKAQCDSFDFKSNALILFSAEILVHPAGVHFAFMSHSYESLLFCSIKSFIDARLPAPARAQAAWRRFPAI